MTATLPSISADLLYLLLFVVVMPFCLALSLMVKYALVYIFARQQRLWPALAAAWRLFKKSWLITVETSFMLFLFTVIFTFAVLFIISALAIPLYFITVFLALVVQPQLYVVFYPLLILIALVLFVLSGSVWSAFYTVTWTNLFVEVESGAGESKIVRLINKFRS